MATDITTGEIGVDDHLHIIAALKRALRARAISYAQVASALNLSEATIKRQFSRGGFTLERFQAICALAGTSIHALSQSRERSEGTTVGLSNEDELLIARDRRLLLVAMCVLCNFTLEAIVHRYQLTRAEAIRLLLKLDAIGFLELLPENRIRLRVGPRFEWLPNGPVLRLLRARLKDDYFSTLFSRPGESLLVLHGEFSEGANGTLVDKLKETISAYTAARRYSRRTSPSAGAPQTLVVSLRPWDLEEFRDLRRKADITTTTNWSATA